MSNRIGRGVAGILVCTSMIGCVSHSGEKNLPPDQVPQAVMDSLRNKFPDLAVKKASTERENGQDIIEVAFSARGGSYEAESTPRGKLIAIDRMVEVRDLPGAVTHAIHEKYPDAKITSAEEVTKNDAIAYHEVNIVSGSQRMELQVDPAGKIINEEKKSAEDKD